MQLRWTAKKKMKHYFEQLRVLGNNLIGIISANCLFRQATLNIPVANSIVTLGGSSLEWNVRTCG